MISRKSFTQRVREGLREISSPDHFRYHLAEWVSRLIYPHYKFSEYGRIWLTSEFAQLFERLSQSRNFHALDRAFTLSELIKLTLHLPGDTAECGVNRGATSYFICRAIGERGKTHHGFDSFEGLSLPNPEIDGDEWQAGDLSVDQVEALQNLGQFNFCLLYKGWIPTRFMEVQDRLFSFVHIDVDLYQPTYDSLNFFYDRTVTGGIILFDDYGLIKCPGAKRAIDEFLTGRPESVINLPTGQAFLIKR